MLPCSSPVDGLLTCIALYRCWLLYIASDSELRDSRCQRMTFSSNLNWKKIKVIGRYALTLSRSCHHVLRMYNILAFFQPRRVVPNLRQSWQIFVKTGSIMSWLFLRMAGDMSGSGDLFRLRCPTACVSLPGVTTSPGWDCKFQAGRKGSKVLIILGTDWVKEALKCLTKPGYVRAIRSFKVAGSQLPVIFVNLEQLSC